MAARRNIFTPEYGASPIPKSKGRAPLPPPDTRPGVPLSMGGAPAPAPGQPGQQPQAPPQASAQPGGEAMGAGAGPTDPDIAQLLQRLLAEMGRGGGQHG